MDTASWHRRLLSSANSISSRILLHAVGRTPKSFIDGKCALSRGPGVITPRLLYRKYRDAKRIDDLALSMVSRSNRNSLWRSLLGYGSSEALVTATSVLYFWKVTPWGLVADRGVVPSNLFPYHNMLSSQNVTLLHRIWRQYAGPKIC